MFPKVLCLVLPHTAGACVEHAWCVNFPLFVWWNLVMKPLLIAQWCMYWLYKCISMFSCTSFPIFDVLAYVRDFFVWDWLCILAYAWVCVRYLCLRAFFACAIMRIFLLCKHMWKILCVKVFVCEFCVWEALSVHAFMRIFLLASICEDLCVWVFVCEFCVWELFSCMRLCVFFASMHVWDFCAWEFCVSALFARLLMRVFFLLAWVYVRVLCGGESAFWACACACFCSTNLVLWLQVSCLRAEFFFVCENFVCVGTFFRVS
jgi:hypothetical protein